MGPKGEESTRSRLGKWCCWFPQRSEVDGFRLDSSPRRTTRCKNMHRVVVYGVAPGISPGIIDSVSPRLINQAVLEMADPDLYPYPSNLHCIYCRVNISEQANMASNVMILPLQIYFWSKVRWTVYAWVRYNFTCALTFFNHLIVMTSCFPKTSCRTVVTQTSPRIAGANLHMFYIKRHLLFSFKEHVAALQGGDIHSNVQS